jgi:carbamoyl-phosphate synthase large subunit
MSEKINVLMTGAGSPGGPGIIASLKQDPDITLHVADMNPNASGRFLHDKFFQIPSAADENFIESLATLCKHQRIDVILPLVTRELPIFAKSFSYFEEIGTKVVVSDANALNILNDKGSLYDNLVKLGLPCVEYYTAVNAKQLLDSVAEFINSKRLCVIKPCNGNGSRGIRVIGDNVNRYDLLFNHKPNSLYMSCAELELIVKGRDIPKMVVSEYLPGEEVTVDTLVSNREVHLFLARKRLKMNGGISVQGEFIENSQIKKYVNDLCARLDGVYGPIGFQLKQNENGIYHFIESNPRIQGTSVAAAGLGINFPRNVIDLAMGKKILTTPRTYGVGFVRYYNEVFYDTQR